MRLSLLKIFTAAVVLTQYVCNAFGETLGDTWFSWVGLHLSTFNIARRLRQGSTRVHLMARVCSTAGVELRGGLAGKCHSRTFEHLCVWGKATGAQHVQRSLRRPFQAAGQDCDRTAKFTSPRTCICTKTRAMDQSSGEVNFAALKTLHSA